jgi:hypothetical protein
MSLGGIVRSFLQEPQALLHLYIIMGFLQVLCQDEGQLQSDQIPCLKTLGMYGHHRFA